MMYPNKYEQQKQAFDQRQRLGGSILSPMTYKRTFGQQGRVKTFGANDDRVIEVIRGILNGSGQDEIVNTYADLLPQLNVSTTFLTDYKNGAQREELIQAYPDLSDRVKGQLLDLADRKILVDQKWEEYDSYDLDRDFSSEEREKMLKIFEEWGSTGWSKFEAIDTIMKEREEKKISTRSLKGMASSIAGDWGWAEWINPIGKITETIDDIVQKIPTLSEEEWDQFAREKLGGFGEGMGMLPAIIANTMPSLLKTATGTARGITNPFDTAYWLGALVGTKEGRGLLKDRYWDNLKKTATEDPVGLALDILTLIAGGAGAVAKVSNVASKGARLANLSKTASKLGRVANKTSAFWKTAGSFGDVGLDVLHNGMLGKLSEAIGAKSGLAKGGLKYLQYSQKPLEALRDLRNGIEKSLDNHLIDERTKKALENNPYIVKWWQKTKNYIDENGLSPESKKEINASHIQGLGNEILDLIKKRKESLTESGKWYEEIRNQNQTFDNSITESKLDYFLQEKGIKVKDWVLDFEDSTVVKDADMKAIQRAYGWITRPEYDAKSGLAQRRKLDQLAYPDGKPSEWTKIIKGMRKVFDTTMKESISGLKELDDNFSQQIQALNEIQEGLVYKDGARKGEIKDNFNQIINTLDGPNRAVMAERLNQLRPWLLEEIQAVHHMKKLTDAYYKTPVMWKSMLAKGGGMILGGVGWAGHWPLGVVAGALAGFFAEKWLSKYSQSRVQKMIDGLGKEAKMKLEKIGGKLEADKELTEKEDRLMQEIAEKLQDQKKTPKEEGLGKLREWAETKYQLAESTITWFNKKKFLDSFKVDTNNPVHIDAMKEIFKDEYEKLTKEYLWMNDGKIYKTASWIAKKRKEWWVVLLDEHYERIKNPTLDDYKNEAIKERETFVLSRIKGLYWRYLQDNGKAEIIQANKNLIKEYPTIEKEVLAKEGIWIDKYYDIKLNKRGFKGLLGEYHKSIKNRIETIDPIAEWRIKTEITDKNQWMLTALYKAWESNNATIKWYASSEWFDANHEYYDMKNKYVKEALDEWTKNKINDIEPLTFGDVLYFNFKDWRQMSFHRVVDDKSFENIGTEWYVYKWRIIKREGWLFIWNEQIVNPLTLELEDYKKLYLENKDGIKYQKHWVANPLEKNISAQRATQLKNIRNGKSVQELADHYGIDIKTVEKITTPEGLQAYGKYGDWIITLAEKIKEGTAPHELFHATFDLVDQARKETILEWIMKEKKLDKVQAEEFLADNFSEYFRTGRLKGEKIVGNVGRTLGAKLMQSVKAFFQKVKEWLTGASKNKKQVKQLFDEILDGEIDRNMLGEVLGNKKDGLPLNQLQDAKGSIGKPSSPPTTSLAGALEGNSSKSITISPENANLYKNNLKQLWGKSHQHSPETFLRELKNSFGVKGSSSYISNNLSDWAHTLRISNHSAKAWNNKLRGHPEKNTSIVIKLADTKFKRNKAVDLIEFVYDPANLTPEKMQGIIKGIQDWIDTGNYTDKGYDATHTSVRASLENGEVKYQLVYHGSPYEFDRFDSSHMGKGAGSQAHGWGHYVSIDKEIWKAYADPTQTPGEALRFKWKKGSLYEVEVPDPVKTDTPTKSNYLYESRKLDRDELMQFYGYLKTNKRGNIDVFKKWVDTGHIGDGEDLYGALSYVLGWDKAASLFLKEMGYDGVSYYDVWDWQAYVIFDDAKLEIKKHTKL